MEPTNFCPTWLPTPCLQTKDMMRTLRVLDQLQRQGKTPVIPPKRNRTTPRAYDKDLYKARHLIENFFAKLKQYRAIATRYDKRATNFLGAIYLAASVIWLI
jgi:transposase